MDGTFESTMRRALAALKEGDTVALCTVVQSRGSTPRHEGARMLVWADGRIFGTIGGGTFEERVIQDAQAAIEEGRARVGRYVFSTNPDHEDSLGLCGGASDVFVEVLKPRPHLLLLGAGHIARELARMAAQMDMRVTVIDDRPEWLRAEDYPPQVARARVGYERESETLDPLPVSLTPNTYVVLATWGWDGPALAQVLSAPVAYVGLVASRTKARALVERFAAEVPPAELEARLHTPAGLDLGAETPAEIALSILAEVLATLNKRSARPLREVKPLKLGKQQPA